MTDPHEALVEGVARAYAVAWREDIKQYIGMDVPSWDEMSEAQHDAMRRCSRAVIALIAEQTKEATSEMLGHGLYGSPLGEQWEKMHRASCLWPKEPGK